jgi:hypothetical protein
MLHKLNSVCFGNISSSSLRSVIQDGYLDAWAVLMISDSNCWCHRIVISSDCFINSRLFNDISFNHIESVGISPESFIGIESIVQFPVHSNVFRSAIFDWKWCEFNIKFNEFRENLRLSDFDDSSLISDWIIEWNSPLFKESTFLVDDIFWEFTKASWKRASPLRLKDVSSFTVILISLFFKSPVGKHSIDLSIFFDMTLVLLNNDSEWLFDSLSFMSVLEKSFTLVGETLNIKFRTLIF